jgi:6-pyruvoyltetrahydropterin/6-carboxytetrahydropterin synthase
MMYLTRRFGFSSSHRLHAAGLDAAGNSCAFGVCQNMHGHNYKLEVTVRGVVDQHTGFFCNVMDLVALVDRLVVKPCDHQYLNDLPLFQGVTTTMENLTTRIWGAIEAPLREQGMELYEVQLGETDEHWARLRRD